jgi:hypothetical protein
MSTWSVFVPDIDTDGNSTCIAPYARILAVKTKNRRKLHLSRLGRLKIAHYRSGAQMLEANVKQTLDTHRLNY